MQVIQDNLLKARDKAKAKMLNKSGHQTQNQKQSNQSNKNSSSPNQYNKFDEFGSKYRPSSKKQRSVAFSENKSKFVRKKTNIDKPLFDQGSKKARGSQLHDSEDSFASSDVEDDDDGCSNCGHVNKNKSSPLKLNFNKKNPAKDLVTQFEHMILGRQRNIYGRVMNDVMKRVKSNSPSRLSAPIEENQFERMTTSVYASNVTQPGDKGISAQGPEAVPFFVKKT